MQPHAVRGNPLDRAVDGVDVQSHDVDEPVDREVLEESGTLHGEVGAVDLQQEAARVDQRVLLPHLAGERRDVRLVIAVVRVEQDGGDRAR
jgi:hypothetical protein